MLTLSVDRTSIREKWRNGTLAGFFERRIIIELKVLEVTVILTIVR